jgi:hypothetical protein
MALQPLLPKFAHAHVNTRPHKGTWQATNGAHSRLKRMLKEYEYEPGVDNFVRCLNNEFEDQYSTFDEHNDYKYPQDATGPVSRVSNLAGCANPRSSRSSRRPRAPSSRPSCATRATSATRGRTSAPSTACLTGMRFRAPRQTRCGWTTSRPTGLPGTPTRRGTCSTPLRRRTAASLPGSRKRPPSRPSSCTHGRGCGPRRGTMTPHWGSWVVRTCSPAACLRSVGGATARPCS